MEFSAVYIVLGVLIVIFIIVYIKSSIERKAKSEELIKKTSNVDFNKTSSVDNYIWIDEKRKKWVFPTKLPTGNNQYVVTTDSKIYDYSDLISYELIEDGKTITKGGVSIGRAVVGGALFGGVGAVIGGTSGKKVNNTICKVLSIKMTIKDFKNPTMYFNLLKYETQTDSLAYKNAYNTAQRILSVLDIISTYNEKPSNSTTSSKTTSSSNMTSSIDEVKKLKELLDIGAITQEEFDTKKKQLLNL
ncbi:MAG: SHOCT domain-containing protein [Ruminococcus sp.]|nr:SHOCT domain-containing protein [Ruminococcus sp.]